jgi:hypothetical protein
MTVSIRGAGKRARTVESVVVQRETDIFQLGFRDCLAFGKEVLLGMREFWITVSSKSAGRPI